MCIVLCFIFMFERIEYEGISHHGRQSPVPNSYKLAAQLIVNIIKERYCMWVGEWHCLEVYLYQIG